MRCPNCKNKVLQKSGGRTRLRTHGPVEFENGVCRTKCHWCKSAVEMRLSLHTPEDIPGERFIIPDGDQS